MRIGILLSALLLNLACGKGDASDDGSVETGNDTGILDRDGDGVPDDQDCDPDDPYTYPGADDVPYDGKDNDCCCETQGESADCCGDLVDWDGDGYDATSAGGTDCNDGNPDIYPGAQEVCYDGIDQDCAGDEDTDDCDLDGHDRYSDCNDEDPTAYPGAPEIWYDGADQDCSGPGVSDYDQDYDGQDHWDYNDGTDCDDMDPEAYLGAEERWDGTDRDCDTIVDKLTERDGDREWYANTSNRSGLMGFGAGLLGDLDGDGGLDLAVSGIGISIPDADGNETVGFYGATYLLDFGDSDGTMFEVAHGMVTPSAQEYHGYDGASLSDLDGDGLMEYVVGTPGYVSGTTQGKVEFFSGATLLAGGTMTADFDIFGNSLAGVDVVNLGDIDQDGLDELGIGPREYAGATLNIFSGAILGAATGDVSKSQAMATLSGSNAGGRSVGGLDFDQDGFADVLMGMNWDVSGKVLLISGADIVAGSASLNNAASLKGSEGSLVGHSNGWLDDATGDGYPEVVVSAPGLDGDKTASGMVYVIDGDDLPTGNAKASDLAFYTLLGNVENGHMISAENSGDFDGDGQADLVVSHPGDFLGLANYGVKGRTFVHWGPDIQLGGVVEAKETDVEFTSTGADDLFGYNHLIGDLNADGLDDLIILAPGANGLAGYTIAFLSQL
jgi:hypothetical protein